MNYIRDALFLCSTLSVQGWPYSGVSRWDATSNEDLFHVGSIVWVKQQWEWVVEWLTG